MITINLTGTEYVLINSLVGVYMGTCSENGDQPAVELCKQIKVKLHQAVAIASVYPKRSPVGL